nr:unnamed protein product [Callosobruchus chinensis]
MMVSTDHCEFSPVEKFHKVLLWRQQSPPVEATKSSCGGNKVLLWRQQSPPEEATKSFCGGNKTLLWR